jgi:hypothetical protein
VTEELIVAIVADTAVGDALATGFEEEGVPVTVLTAHGTPEALAREAARRALLGIGIGGDGERLALVLAGASGRAYLEAPTAAARAFGRHTARLAARRPLTPD